jgi:hypothetical protein
VTQVHHFATEKIAELAKESRHYLWLTFATTITGCSAWYPQHREMLVMFDYVAVAAGSAFNAGYYGIRLCRVVRDCSTLFDHEIEILWRARL